MLQKNVEGNISMTKVIEDLKKKPQMISLEVKNTTCEVKNIMCEVKNTCWRLITAKKKKILHKKKSGLFS